MNYLQLATNEGIILQSESIYHNKKLCDLYLTNFNIICVEHKKSLLKTTYIPIKFPLCNIKVVNSQTQASALKGDSSWILQILFLDSIEKFEFKYDFLGGQKKKRDVEKWIENLESLTSKTDSKNGSSGITEKIKNVLGHVGFNSDKREPKNITISCTGCGAKLSGTKGNIVKCEFCGVEQAIKKSK